MLLREVTEVFHSLKRQAEEYYDYHIRDRQSKVRHDKDVRNPLRALIKVIN